VSAKLSDAEFEEFKRRLNEAIHEIVFAAQHLDQDDTDEALTCLVTAGGTLEEVANEIASKEAA
jgi:hypothetical protein